MIIKLGLSTIIVAMMLVSLHAIEDMSKWLRPAEVPQPKDNKLTPERIELGPAGRKGFGSGATVAGLAPGGLWPCAVDRRPGELRPG